MDLSPKRRMPLSKIPYGGRNSKTNTRSNSHSVVDNSNKPSESLPTKNGASGTSSCSEPPPSGPTSGPTCPTIGPTGVESPQRNSGPPTPLLSENMDPYAPPLHFEKPVQKKMECLGSYSSVVGGGTQHSPCPMLTPSLVNYVRSELTSHVQGWPADILEKRAKKLKEQAYQLGYLQCTRVSSDLKCFRAIVRHNVIQATLQEQKILYVRQQISLIEEMKPKNFFMSEE